MSKTFNLREIKKSDWKFLLEWRNDKVTRQNFFHSELISINKHKEYISDSITNPNRTIFILEYNEIPVGTIREDILDKDEFELSYEISPMFRGKKIGQMMMGLYLIERKGSFLCLVKAENTASIKMIQKLGFKLFKAENRVNFYMLKNNKDYKFNNLSLKDDNKSVTKTKLNINSKNISNYVITVLSDETTWMAPWIEELLEEWSEAGNRINWVHNPIEVSKGDFCFMLSCSRIVKANILKRNVHNLVVHESDLPKGKGWSPLSWQVLEGKSSIPVTLFEAQEEIDGGVIYLQDYIELDGDELVNELREKQAIATLDICRKFMNQYPSILNSAETQNGESSFYPKRNSVDSMININKNIREQFDLLRIVDDERYPAYFDLLGSRYYLKIEKEL